MNTHRTIIRAGVCMLLSLAFLGGIAYAQASFSQLLSFQGRLSAPDGKPLPAGPYAVKFTMYDAENGGNALWTETLGVTQAGGTFTAFLGTMTPFPADLFAGGDRWLGIKVGNDPEMAQRLRLTPSPWAIQAANADKVDGLHASKTAAPDTLLALDTQGRFPVEVIPAAVPSGGIIMWSGTLSQIPSGWQLCDGTNGSPDLRDRFVLGVRADENPGETGGSHRVTLTSDNMPKHKHGFTTDEAGIHWHQHTATVCSAGTFWIGGVVPTKLLYDFHREDMFATHDAGSHTHTGTTDELGDSAPFDSRPAYYRLAFIMKL